MLYLHKYFFFFLILLSYFDFHLYASGTITSSSSQKETHEQLLKKWFDTAELGMCDGAIKYFIFIHKVDVNVQDERGMTALMYASVNRDEKAVKCLLKVPRININAQDKNGGTALMHACNRAYENIVKLLLQAKNININAQDKKGFTVLMYSSRVVDLETSPTQIRLYNIAKLLVQIPGINVNAQNKYGFTALIIASYANNEDIVKLLLRVPGLDINLTDNDHCTVLIHASRNGHEHIVRLLLQIPSVNVNIQTTYGGDTALICASGNRHMNIVKLLLAIPNINVNAQNKFGITALWHAAFYDHEEIAKLLLQTPGINVNSQNENSISAISIACESETQRHKSSIVGKLIQNKINELISAAFEAISHKDLKRIKEIYTQLMPQQIESIFDENGNTLLDKAFAANCPETIFYLLQNTKDPRESLASFPFELINPTSKLFEYFINLAFYRESEEDEKAPASPASKIFKQKHCQVCLNESHTLCGRCKKVYYCSAKCQKADWRKHKLICTVKN